MKKNYQNPVVWVETFIMDASIAAGGCGDSAQEAINQEVLKAYEELQGLGVTQEEFNAALGASNGTYCYNTLSNPLSTFSMS